jgi:hypothetical protein
VRGQEARATAETEGERRLHSPVVTALRESSPLLGASIALFAAGYLCYWFHVSLGPSAFSLWALLLVLGFVAAIGASISWFFVDEEATEEEIPVASPPELGRPRPEVRKGLESEPWFEGPPTLSPLANADAVAPGTKAPETGLVLQELDVIQREVAPRRSASPAVPR